MHSILRKEFDRHQFFSTNVWFSVILFFAFLVRVLWLTQFPLRVDGDSAQMALDAVTAVQEKVQFFSVGWMANQNAVYYLYGGVLRIAGYSIFGMRIFSAIGGVLSIWAVYLMSSAMFDKKTAFLAAFFLSFLPIHIAFSRMGTDVTYVSWFLPIILYVFFQGVREYALKYFIFAGMLIGISQYFYQPVRFIPLVVIFSCVLLLLVKKMRNNLIIGFLIMFMTSFMLYLPMIRYYHAHSGEFLSRVKQVSIIQSGHLEQEIREGRVRQLLQGQLISPYLAFFSDVEIAPIHYFQHRFIPLFGSLLCFIGMLVAFFRYKQYMYYIVHFWFFAGVLLCGVLVLPSLQASRYFIVLPAVCIYMAIGSLFLIDKVKKTHRLLFMSMLLLIYACSSIFSYIAYERYDSYAYDHNTQIASFAGRYLAKSEKDYVLYFLGDNNMYYNAVPSLRFLTKKEGIDIPLSQDIAMERFPANSVFIILPSRIGEAIHLQNHYPHGHLEAFRNPRGDLLFYLFSATSPI